MSDAPPNSGSGRWMRIALFVSLALNLAVVGAVAGHLLGDGPPQRGSRVSDDAAIPYTRAFKDDQRRELGRSLRREVGRRPSQGPEFFLGYREALSVLRSDPFDPAALTAVLSAQAQRTVDRREAAQAVLAGYLSGLSEAERQAYADRLEAQIEHLEERGKKWRKKDGQGR